MYYRCIRTCPLAWIALTFGVSFGMLGYALFKHDLPSFEDPLVGFEVRQSELASRLNTWKLLGESTSLNGLLSLYPKPFENNPTTTTTTTESPKEETTTQPPPVKEKKPKSKKGKNRNETRRAKTKPNNKANLTDADHDPFHSRNHQIEKSQTHFCGKIMEEYVHVVVEATDQSNLLEVNALRNVCNLDRFLLRMEHIDYIKPATNSTTNWSAKDSSQRHFNDYCETKNLDNCCPSWSLVNYVLLLANKTQCDSLVEEDIATFVSLLRSCSFYYAEMYLNEDCANDPSLCPTAKPICYENDNLVYNVFHYLVDYRFFGMNQEILHKNDSIRVGHNASSLPFLTLTSIFLPMAKNSKLMPYYEAINEPLKLLNISPSELSYGNVHIVAADLGLKHSLFSESLVDDLILICISTCVIFFSLLLYTRSLVLTLTALLTNAASLASAYFIYKCLFGIEFFPFLNLLSVIILVGIGSDNALIYCKSWCCVVSSTSHTTISNNNRRHRIEFHQQMDEAMRHVLVSSFCASLTTCCAFFAGYFSEITSLKCFSIFAGTLIVTNFIITVITFPASIILSEKLSQRLCFSSLVLANNKLYNRIECFTSGLSKFVFNQVILKLVFNFRYVLSFIFLFIAVGSAFIVLYSPGLKMPTSQEFQVFSSQHLFERYDLKYKNEFWFSRFYQQPQSDTNSANSANSATNQISSVVLPIRVVFGVLPKDNGDALNPANRGTLVFDPDFDVSNPTSQSWLLDFCQLLKIQHFARTTMGPLSTNCIIETLKSWMDSRRCSETVGGETVSLFPCCQQAKFPYEPEVFSQCLVEMTELLHRTPSYLLSLNRAGALFNSSKVGSVKAVIVEYDSVYDAFSNSHQEMAYRWRTMDEWVREQLKFAPKGMHNGWFVTINMEFFALQQSLSAGVIQSLLIAVAFAFLILICTTWNIRLSLLSTVTISCLIFTTIAVLILLDWRLNIIESITISLTIGLAIDATLHYTIAYKLLAKGNRLLGIQMTLARIGSPVAMGAITTFLAGFIMLFSYILAYIQIGTFLMVLSIVSWLYSSLFHLSLLGIFGAHHEKSLISFDFLARLKQHLSLKRFSFKSSTSTNNDNANSLAKEEPVQAFLLNHHAPDGTYSPPNGKSSSMSSSIGTLNRRELLDDSDGVCLRVTSI